MGCTFDCYSTTFNARSYVITLLIIAWVIPLIFIVTAYIRIIQYVRKSFVRNKSTMNMMCIQWGCRITKFQMNDENELNVCENHKCLPHVQQRVSSNYLLLHLCSNFTIWRLISLYFLQLLFWWNFICQHNEIKSYVLYICKGNLYKVLKKYIHITNKVNTKLSFI